MVGMVGHGIYPEVEIFSGWVVGVGLLGLC